MAQKWLVVANPGLNMSEVEADDVMEARERARQPGRFRSSEEIHSFFLKPMTPSYVGEDTPAFILDA